MVRLQKALAEAGIASRRRCEEYITAGRVTVDGQVVRTLGKKVDPEKQDIRFDGIPVKPGRKVYILLNKPRGYICTSADEYGRKRVLDLIDPRYGRLHSVGRLDADSEGLIILTNDGELTERLTHPRYGVEKVYRVEVKGSIRNGEIERVRRGVVIFGRRARPTKVTRLFADRRKEVLEVVLREGRNREIRRIFAKLGLTVRSLKRIAFGPLRLRGLGSGRYRELTQREVQLLKGLKNEEKISSHNAVAESPRR